MFRPLFQYCQLPSRHRKLVLQATPALIQSVVSLKLLGFRQPTREAASTPPEELRVSIDQYLHDTATAVRRVSNGLGIGTCLSRSLAIRKLLQKKGINTEFRIGVNKNENGLKAHAWLEFNGVPVGDEPVHIYNVFSELK